MTMHRSGQIPASVPGQPSTYVCHIQGSFTIFQVRDVMCVQMTTGVLHNRSGTSAYRFFGNRASDKHPLRRWSAVVDSSGSDYLTSSKNSFSRLISADVNLSEFHAAISRRSRPWPGPWRTSTTGMMEHSHRQSTGLPAIYSDFDVDN